MLKALTEFYLAVHDLWDSQGALGQANAKGLRNEQLLPYDRNLKRAMDRLTMADEAVHRMGKKGG